MIHWGSFIMIYVSDTFQLSFRENPISASEPTRGLKFIVARAPITALKIPSLRFGLLFPLKLGLCTMRWFVTLSEYCNSNLHKNYTRTAEVSRPQRRAMYSLYTYHVLKLEDSVSFASGCATRTVARERGMRSSRSRNRRCSPNMLTIYKVAGGSVPLNSILPPRSASTFIACLFVLIFQIHKTFFAFQCQTLERRMAMFSRTSLDE